MEAAQATSHEPAIRELLHLDIYYRRRLGETPVLDDYGSRFPDLDLNWTGDFACSEIRLAESGDSVVDSASTLPFVKRTPNGHQTACAAAKGRIAHFELLGELGRGGMGVVYRARDLNADRIVALKIIRPDRLDSMTAADREQWLRRFRRAIAR